MFFNFTVPSSLNRYLFNSPGAHMQSKYTTVADILSAGPIIKRSQEAAMLSARDMKGSQIQRWELGLGLGCIILLALIVVGLMSRIFKSRSSRQRNDLESDRIELH